MRIEKLFNSAKTRWSGVFDTGEEVALSDEALAFCVSALQQIYLLKSRADILGSAFEIMVNPTMKGDSFQAGDNTLLAQPITRGMQPKYADDEEDPSSLEYEGMVLPDGSTLDAGNGDRNVCALKSNCVRWGFLDLSLARSVERDWALSKGKRSLVIRNDVLVNSTGDGTIGRVALYDFDAPAVVDGHISVLQLENSKLAWYVAALLRAVKISSTDI